MFPPSCTWIQQNLLAILLYKITESFGDVVWYTKKNGVKLLQDKYCYKNQAPHFDNVVLCDFIFCFSSIDHETKDKSRSYYVNAIKKFFIDVTFCYSQTLNNTYLSVLPCRKYAN